MNQVVQETRDLVYYVPIGGLKQESLIFAWAGLNTFIKCL